MQKLEADLKRLVPGIVDGMRFDVSLERILEKLQSQEQKIESAEWAVVHLREAAKNLLSAVKKDPHPLSCHCVFCKLDHAMTCTCGFADKRNKDEKEPT